jgi:3-hexulose-6-phosphate synthase
MRAKLQLALDMPDLTQALRLLELVHDYVDVIEIGTPLLKSQGVRAIHEIRRAYPAKPRLADAKTMDTGEYEADFCFAAGANLMTVLGVADDSTISGAVRSAQRHQRTVVVDLLNVPQKTPRARRAAALGAQAVAVHSGIDQQRRGCTPLADLAELSEAELGIDVAVAGGIGPHSLDMILERHPQVVIVGGAITQAANPASVAAEMRERLG